MSSEQSTEGLVKVPVLHPAPAARLVMGLPADKFRVAIGSTLPGPKPVLTVTELPKIETPGYTSPPEHVPNHTSTQRTVNHREMSHYESHQHSGPHQIPHGLRNELEVYKHGDFYGCGVD